MAIIYETPQAHQRAVEMGERVSRVVEIHHETTVYVREFDLITQRRGETLRTICTYSAERAHQIACEMTVLAQPENWQDPPEVVAQRSTWQEARAQLDTMVSAVLAHQCDITGRTPTDQEIHTWVHKTLVAFPELDEDDAPALIQAIQLRHHR